MWKSYDDLDVLKGVSFELAQRDVKVIFGPSGSGKSTLLRCINMLEPPDKGEVYLSGQNLMESKVNINALRAKIGMVFQKPCVFPKTISENVLFGLKFAKKCSIHQRQAIVEEKLKAVALWNEVKHRLDDMQIF